MLLRSALKHLNAAKGIVSYVLSIISGQPVVWGMPVSAGIELTNCCNLNCPECVTGSGLMKRPSGFMSEALFAKIIDELSPYMYNINLYFQGEPMLHPSFFRFIHKTGDLKLTISTNGHFLDPGNAFRLARSGAHRLIVSLDGMSPEVYEMYRRGGDLARVKEGIMNVSAAIKETGSRMRLEIQYLVSKFNERDIPEAESFARKADAVLTFKSMQVINNDRITFWMPENKKFRRYKTSNGAPALNRKNRNGCLRTFLNPVITWNGTVVPCCFDKNGDHTLGDLRNESFREIWHGEKNRKFRKMVLSDRDRIEICSNCTTGLKGVKY